MNVTRWLNGADAPGCPVRSCRCGARLIWTVRRLPSTTLRRVIPASRLDIDHSAFPLHQGDHVSDPWGQRGVIVAVAPRAEHGIGAVRVRYDDGREIQYSMLDHPLRKIDAE